MDDDEAEEIKEQLLEQIKNFPEDKRKEAEEKILNMSNEELEEFLKQNSLQSPRQGECIFCMILEGKMKAYKIAEDKDSIAILEINPIGKGHALIVPRKHSETAKIPKSSFSLAKKVADKIKSKFNPLDIKIATSNIMGHALVEIIPFYKDTDQSKRKKAEEKDLIEIQQLWYFVKKEKKPNAVKQQATVSKESNLPKLKARIP